MALTPGTRLGAYAILAPLGAGGMGEVYRARDTKLDRDVAIKVLPQSVAGDPDTRARFEREAKAVAALSHQNILAIHDFGNEGGIAYAVTELLEGETLRAKLDAGPITQKQAVDYALQVARGLSAAHGKGIVHRDLKPENLFITRDDHVKVLDFGLAKRVETVGPEMNAPTISSHTEPGTIMGTAGYMSPEQVKGLPIDHRSDIFSFGTILYEMLSGTRAFKRDTNAETMAAIMRDEPPELSASGRNISPALARVVKHCLEKDREHRFQSSRDIAFSLLEQSSTSGTTAPREIVPPIRAAGFWIAVLPFESSGDAEMATFANGLVEEITTGLSRFRYLSVIANASSARLKGEVGDDRALGARLGARYVLAGSSRKGGSAIRVSAQLVDTQTGAQLWAETYNRDLHTSSIFSIQDDVAARIVATVADSYGVLVHSMRSATAWKDDVDLAPVEWQFQYFAYREQITPSTHAALKSRLQRVLERDDRRSDVWACLAQIYVDEYAFGFSGDPTALDRALTAGRRAVELDRANQFALVALAQVHFFRRDLAAFGPAAERAMALNPLNTDAVGILGLQIVHTREFERGTAIVRRAMELNANHAGWMHFAPLWNHFHKGEYEQVLECANRVDVPGLFWPYLVMAAACGHLGRRAEAEAAVRDLLVLDPEFAAHARSNIESWHFASGLMEPLIEGLRKAGLAISATSGSPGSPERTEPIAARAHRAESGTDSGQVRADEGFGVGVMPFRSSGGSAELANLAAGLSEDIVAGLSRFSYLRVRSAGREAGARYVMEGSLRQGGTKVRLAVLLVDTDSGARIWAETYERPFDPDATFDLQDELVSRIVGTCADTFGVLARSISEAVRRREPGQLGPYEALMRGFGYHHRLTEPEHAAAREALERAVDLAPANADCWAMLSWITSHEYGHGFNARPASLDRALAAARRAVDIAPSNALAQQALAVALFFRKDRVACLAAAERAIALNPLDTSNEAMFLIAFSGDWDRGCALIRRAIELNPHHPRWYELTLAINEYRLGNYRGAVETVAKANAPDVFWGNLTLAAAYGQLGELPAARQALKDLLAQKEDFAKTAPELMGRWMDPQLVSHLIEGLRQAGLEVASGTNGKLLIEGLREPGVDVFVPARPASDPVVKPDAGVAIAVLPFSDMSPGKDQEYLCEGMAEEIMNALVQVGGIRVASRTSAFRARKDGSDLSAIARALSVGHILEGSVRTSGTRMRVTAQLTDAMSGYQLWSERYDREAADIFAVQDEITAGVVEAVRARLTPGERTVRARAQVADLEAYRLYLKGRHLRYTKNDHGGALLCFEKATALDPSHGPSWVGLADVSVLSAAYGLRPSRAGYQAAKDALQIASGLQAESAESCYVEAMMALGERRWLDLERFLDRARQLDPTHVQALCVSGTLHALHGRIDEALEALEQARQIDPLAPYPYAMTGLCLEQARRPEEAGLFLDQALAFDGDNILALWVSGAALTAQGLFGPAIARLERAVALSNRGAFVHGVLGWALAEVGRIEDANAVLAALRARAAPAPTALPEAWILAALGDTDGAWRVLDQVCDEKQLLVSFTGLPGFDRLRTDTRFGSFLEKLGLPQC